MYNEKDIKQLTPYEHVRLRPGMYVGSVEDPTHLLIELIDNALDEILTTETRKQHELKVLIDHRNVLYGVSDTGRGIPFGKHPEYNKPVIEVVATELFSGAKFEKHAYKISAGLHGIGLTVVNFLSKEMTIASARQCKIAQIHFKEGKRVSFTVKDQQEKPCVTGTKVVFKPDDQIFDTVLIPLEKIVSYLETLYYDPEIRENVSISIIFYDIQGNKNIIPIKGKQFFKANDLVFEAIARANDETFYLAFSCHPVNSLRSKDQEYLALVNLKPADGTHLTFARSIVADILEDFARKQKTNLTRQELLAGIKLLVSAKISELKFTSQTKNTLSTPVKYFNERFKDKLLKQLQKQIKGDKLAFIKDYIKHLQTLKDALQQQKLANKESFVSIKYGKVERGLNIPNLKDCLSSERKDTELFIVEGQSAGGTLLQVRDPKKHGCLFLRGKTVNAFENPKKALQNKEVLALFKALGIKPGSNDISTLRYERIIIASDADPDGQHIILLVLSILVKFARPLFNTPNIVFIANTPLYGATHKKAKQFYPIYSRAELQKYNTSEYIITRFKGLGEMDPHELKTVLIDKQTRKLQPIIITTDDELELFTNLMLDSNFKRQFLITNDIIRGE